MLGLISLDRLKTDPEHHWFPSGYELFAVQHGAESFKRLTGARKRFADMQVLAFIGTWCPDCQDHVPGFIHVLQAVGFPMDRVQVYALDRAKTFPGGAHLIAQHQITRLPTFVLLEHGKELGRITETPEHGLLEDLASLV